MTPFRDDFEPTPEDRELCREAGLDPDDIREELRDWAARTCATSGDWNANYRGFIRTGKDYRARHPRKRDYAGEVDAFTAGTLTMLRAGGWLPEGATVAGFAP
jgi:hypothetical protein